ncbi:CreA family protein, partial [Shewanella sp.]
MKQQLLPLALGLGLGVIGLTACSDDVGQVSLGLFTTKDVIIDAKHDPKIPGVTCHISRIQANLDFADPSDMSIS